MSEFISGFMVNKKLESANEAIANNKIRFSRQIEQSKGIDLLKKTFIITCVLMWVGALSLMIYGSYTNETIISLYDFGLSKNHFTWSGFILSNLMHLHPLHILFNMIAVVILFNRFYFANLKILISVIIFSALGSSTFSFFIANPESVVIGASGILFGVFSFQMMYIWDLQLKYKDEFDVKKLKKYLLIQGGFCVIINFFPMIAWYAHLGGAFAGFILYKLFKSHLDFSYEAFVLTYYKV